MRPVLTAPGARPSDEAGAPLLQVSNVEVVYDRVILVLKGVSLEVPRGGIVALLGANGAGKTTTLRAVSNLLEAERGRVTKGSIRFQGDAVQGQSPSDLVRRGCIQVMEGRHCFEHLTVEELERTALNVVLPDDAEETGAEHPWELLSSGSRTWG